MESALSRIDFEDKIMSLYLKTSSWVRDDAIGLLGTVMGWRAPAPAKVPESNWDSEDENEAKGKTFQAWSQSQIQEGKKQKIDRDGTYSYSYTENGEAEALFPVSPESIFKS